MTITNFDELAKSPSRGKALQIAEAGYEAINIEKSVSKKIFLNGGFLKIYSSGGKIESFDLSDFRRIFLIGIGKGSAEAAGKLAEIMGGYLGGGITLDVSEPKAKNPKLKTFVGNHPLPTEENARATGEIMDLAASLGEKDLLINFICGGGSALACLQGELDGFVEATKLLTKAGANILELNTVRKHLSEFKGGGLAKMSYPATVVSLIASDVLGDDLSMVASGPTVLDKTTISAAKEVLEKFGIDPKEFDLKKTVGEEKYFEKVKNILFISNKDAVRAMGKKAEDLGFRPVVYSSELKGEAKNVFLPMIKKIKRGEAYLAAGETTVTLIGNQKPEASKRDNNSFHLVGGKGGRNQEAVLGFAVNAFHDSNTASHNLHNLIVLSFASDGRDNTEAAGAIADSLTCRRAADLGLDPELFLSSHDTFNFFEKTGDLIYAEKDNFNVSDLMVAVRE